MRQLIALGKKVPLLQMSEIREMDSLLMCSIMLFTFLSHLWMRSAGSLMLLLYQLHEVSTCLSIVPVWTGVSEPYPAVAEMNGAGLNCYTWE